MTVDVEEWFNILDIPGEVPFEQWDSRENRLESNMMRLLELFRKHDVRVTCFWLGFFAKKYPALVRRCYEAGHEIASHGYAHLLAYKVGREKFKEDVESGKKILEDITGAPVAGFRAAGFSVTAEIDWFFDVIRSAGYLYDSSVFPARRGHGGVDNTPLTDYVIHTPSGDLWEIPQSMIKILGKRVSFFGGGYLRIAPGFLITRGIRTLKKHGRQPVFYVHPREIDPDHPRLEMSTMRKIKSYINLKSTYPKLENLCRNHDFMLMRERIKLDI